MEHVDQFLAHYGYFAIFFLLMLGIVGPLIPDDTILILSGIAVHAGRLQTLPTIAVAFAGSLCGITLSYALGRTGTIYLLERYAPLERWVGHYLPEAQKWFDRYGKWTLFFGYFVAGLRHFTALTAGLAKLRWKTFAAYAYPGGFVWVVSFVGIGYFLGAEWEAIAPLLNRGALIAAIALAVAGVAVWWLRKKKAD